MKKENNPKLIKEVIMLTAGTLITALGVYFFKIPNNFSTGGMSGISIILGNLVKGVSPANFIFILNIVFMLLGFAFVGKDFGWKTIYCSLLFSGAVQVLEWVVPMSAPFTDQKMLELAFAGIIPAVGTAITFKYGGSTGGTDIIAMILRKKIKSDISISMMIADAVIAASTIFFINVETGLYSILGMLLKSFMVQAAIGVINRRKTLLIITTKPEEVEEYITKALHRGATVWKASGAYTHEDKAVLFAAMTPYQAAEVRDYTKKIDDMAFVTVINSNEIYGKGFMSFKDNV